MKTYYYVSIVFEFNSLFKAKPPKSCRLVLEKFISSCDLAKTNHDHLKI